MEKINFNKLAWEAPKHNGVYGYIPTDEYYNQIIEWLKSGIKRWVSRTGNVTTTRIMFKDSRYDAVVEFNHTNKMISWTFREINTYSV